MELKLPGRLGNPEATLETDPRTDPRIAAALQLSAGLPTLEVPDVNASYEEALVYCQAFEEAQAAMHPQMFAAMPTFDGVVTSQEIIKGVDQNDITLHIHQPAERNGPLPAIVHTHGGAMVLMTAEDPMFVRWRNRLASQGMVIIGVEFRNGGGRLGNHPFPAGLNDCASATKWTYANRERLGISSIVISGESGGGNLSIATTMKASQEGWVDQIDGVYAMCPYISGAYASPPGELVSLVENDQYQINRTQMAVMTRVYDPSGNESSNPLAWPLQASNENLIGLPPHLISVNELDPLRDEGLWFYRKLLTAGVSAVGRTVHGTTHAADLGMPDVVPEVHDETVRSIHGFCSALAEAKQS